MASHPPSYDRRKILSGLTFGPVFAVLAAVSSAQIGPPGRLEDRGRRMPVGLAPAGGPALLLDLDRDGLQDLLRASGTRLDILYQTPEGRFEEDPSRPAITFAAPATEITALGHGDLNGDQFDEVVIGLAGADDVVLTTNSILGPGVRRLLPNPVPVDPTQRFAPDALFVGNLDGVRRNDVAVFSASANTRFLVDNGTGLQDLPQSGIPQVLAAPQRAALCVDLDRDGDLDVVCSPNGFSVTHFCENVQGSFVVRQTVPYAAGAIVVAELDGVPGPEVVLFHADAVPRQPVMLSGNPLTVAQPQPLGWQIAAVEVVAGEFNHAVAGRELLVRTLEGEVQVIVGLQGPRTVLVGDERRGLVVADLESDGDSDAVVVGRQPPDAILLSDGRGGFLNTERPALIGAAEFGPQTGVLLGAQPSSDPHLLVFRARGAAGAAARPSYYLNDAGARFVASTGLSLPTYPGFDFATAANAGAIPVSDREIAMLDPTQPGGLFFAARQASQAVGDTTATRWPMANDWFVALAAGRFDVIGTPTGPTSSLTPADLVLGDVFGALRLYRATGGQYAELNGAFVGGGAGPVSSLLAADFDGDGALDICALRRPGVEIWLGSRGQFAAPRFALASASPVLGSVIATSARAADLNGDGAMDIVLVTPNQAPGFRVLQGNGAGGFVDATAAAINVPTVTFPVTDLEILGQGDRAVLLLGLPDGRVLRWVRNLSGAGPWLAPYDELLQHGTGPVVDLVVGDLDGDRDEDLVVLRDGLAPTVLFNREMQFGSLRIAQAGRPLGFEIEGDPVDVSAVLMGFTPIRFELPPFGIFRLADGLSIVQVAIDPSGRAVVNVPIPPTMPALELQFQLASLRAVSGTAEFGNLHRVQFTQH